jgi:hypothetical protein
MLRIRSSLRLLALAAVPAALGTLGAQPMRIAVEPQVSALPGNALWGESTRRVQDGSYGGTGNLRRTTEVGRDAMFLYGARLTFAPGAARWRVVLDGGAGRTRMHFSQHELNRFVSADGSVASTDAVDLEHGQDATMFQLGLRAERDGRWRRWATEASGGLIAQRLRTKEETVSVPVPMGPPFLRALPARSYTDPALAVGAAIGPASGALSGLRLSLRSTHVWRTPDLPNDLALSAYTQLQAKDRAWQWQPEIALGWRMWIGS